MPGPPPTSFRNAFVLSGGAALGAAQVGMLLAMSEAGIEPDLVVGTSVGAVNGAWIVGRPGTEGVSSLADLWRGLRREDVFPTRPLVGLLGFAGRRPNLVPSSGLRGLLREHLRFERIEETTVPFHVIVTDVRTGDDVRLSAGPAIDAVLASAAIPAVFPPVRIGERDFIDGGIVNNTPISHAIELGATTVWVLSTGSACALPEPPRSALAMALHALGLTVNQRLAIDVAHHQEHADLRVVPPLCPIRTSPADFSHGPELIDRAHEATAAWLAAGTVPADQAPLLQNHGHP